MGSQGSGCKYFGSRAVSGRYDSLKTWGGIMGQ